MKLSEEKKKKIAQLYLITRYKLHSLKESFLEGIEAFATEGELSRIERRHREMASWYYGNLQTPQTREFGKYFGEFGYLKFSDEDYVKFLKCPGFFEMGDYITETISKNPLAGCDFRLIGESLCLPKETRKIVRNEKKAWSAYKRCRRKYGD